MFYKKEKNSISLSISHNSHDQSVSFFQHQWIVSDTKLGILNSIQL